MPKGHIGVPERGARVSKNAYRCVRGAYECLKDEHGLIRMHIGISRTCTNLRYFGIGWKYHFFIKISHKKLLA